MASIKYHLIFVCVGLTFQWINGKSTKEFDEKTVEPETDIDFKVIIKRDAGYEPHEGLPRLEGRTFRASEPLDPNGPIPLRGSEERSAASERTLFGGDFNPSHTVFEPTVDDSEDTGTERGAERRDSGSTTGEVSELTSGGEVEDSGSSSGARRYGAQYPYSTTTHDAGDLGPGTHTVTETRTTYYGTGGSSGGAEEVPRYGFVPGGTQTVRTNRRVTLVGGGSSDTDTRYPTDTGTVTTTNRRVTVTGSGDSNSRPRYYNGGRTYRTRTGSSYPDTYSTGRRYVDGRGSSGTTYTSGGTVDGSGPYVFERPRGTTYTGRTRNTYRTGGGTGSSGYYDSTGQYVYTGSRRTGTSGTGTTVTDSGAGSGRYYGSGSSIERTFDPMASYISSDPECPETNTRVTINGLTCTNAISQLGRFVCYNYERVSTECCERCLSVKRSENVGCEYGDRSQQCANIQPSSCYNDRNEQMCCDRCRFYRENFAPAAPGCEYRDHTPECSRILSRPHLCYLSENQDLCCHTCPRLANRDRPTCQWGDQNPELCQPFDSERRVRLNCYLPRVSEFCCSACDRLRARMPQSIPGCMYGDAPVQFSTGRGVLDCSEYIRHYGRENCNDYEIRSKCCYTCRLWRWGY